MKHIGLFEGIGGFSLAARWMGWETLAWCEWDVPLKDVLALTEHKPLFGHPSGKAQKTHWVAFMKRSANGI